MQIYNNLLDNKRRRCLYPKQRAHSGGSNDVAGGKGETVGEPGVDAVAIAATNLITVVF